jgi:MFS family permease
MGVPRRPLLSRTLLALLMGMILANLGGGMYYPFLALFLKSLGFPVDTIGLYFTLASILPLAFQVIGGWISDRIGRVRSIAFGSIAGSVGWVAIVLAPSMAAPLAWLLASEAFGAVTRSLVGPSFDAFVAEQSSNENRARVFAVVQALFMIVDIVGPPLGGLIAERLSFRALLLAAGCLYWAATAVRVGMALAARRQATGTAALPGAAQDEAAAAAPDGRKAGLGRSFALMAALAVSGGVFTWILLVDGALDISGRLNESLLPLFLKEVGRLTESRIGLLRGFSALCTAAAMVPMGSLADRRGERYPIVLGCALVGVSSALFAFGRGMIPFAAAFAVLGVSGGCFMPSLQSLISKAVPARLRGMAFGFLSSSLGVFSFFAPAVGGLLWKRFFPALPLLLSGGLVLLAVIPAWIVLRMPEGRGPGPRR